MEQHVAHVDEPVRQVELGHQNVVVEDIADPSGAYLTAHQPGAARTWRPRRGRNTVCPRTGQVPVQPAEISLAAGNPNPSPSTPGCRRGRLAGVAAQPDLTPE